MHRLFSNLVIVLIASVTEAGIQKATVDHSLSSDFSINPSTEIDVNVVHEIVIAINQLNMNLLEELVHGVSNPFSEKYGKYLSREEVGKLTYNEAGLNAVMNYLKANDIFDYHTTVYGEYVSVRASLRKWEQLFDAKFQPFKHKTSGNIVYRSSSYSLHASLVDHVVDIFNLVDLPVYPNTKREKKGLAPLQNVNLELSTIPGFITPALLNSYYNIFTNKGNTLTSQAIYSSLDQYFSSKDIAIFQHNFSIPSHPVDHDVNHRDKNSKCIEDFGNCAESNLDLQYILAVAQNTPTSITYDNGTDALLMWSITLANSTIHPDVYSISYAFRESYLVDFRSLANSVNRELLKIAAMGVTVLAASGDDGAPGFANRNSTKATCTYDPMFPASSPYVTAVGATMGPETSSSEIACQADLGGGITSGGGFSVLFPAFAQQQTAIKQYFQTVSTQPYPGYNTTGRGYPDVSLAGSYYIITVGGNFHAVSGTSASTPAVAGMITLINAARKAAGRATVGWLNPALYASQGSFANDITAGNSTCTEIVCCRQGYLAASGWDPVTGFGSVDFTRLYNLLMFSPAPSSSPTAMPSAPTRTPTRTPSAPTSVPTAAPTAPTVTPTRTPTAPTSVPTFTPSNIPTFAPTRTPTAPTSVPTFTPSNIPTFAPTRTPTAPTSVPTAAPTAPTVTPTTSPTHKSAGFGLSSTIGRYTTTVIVAVVTLAITF